MHNRILLRLISAAILINLGSSVRTTHATAAGTAHWSLAIHGGAGGPPPEFPSEKQPLIERTLRRALEAGRRILASGGTGLDAVQTAIHIMEDSGLFDAGKSPVLNHKGYAELDASIMSGRDLKAGAVAGVRHIANPIDLARLVMDKSPHVLLVADGAEEFAKEQGINLVPEGYFITDWRQRELKRVLTETSAPKGTLGAVALDTHGDLAAGTSTGGLTNKHTGRIGDSPIIGAGTYAENGVCAVSATGQGEYFIRYTAAADICARVKYRKESIQTAARAVIDELGKVGGDGGVIAMDANGNVATPHSTPTMTRGWVSSEHSAEVIVEVEPTAPHAR